MSDWSAMQSQIDTLEEDNKKLRAELKEAEYHYKECAEGLNEARAQLTAEREKREEAESVASRIPPLTKSADDYVADLRAQLTVERAKVAELEDRFNEQAICAEEFAKATSEVPMLKAKLAEMEKFTRWLMSWIAGLDCHCEHTQSEMGSEAKCFKHMALDKHAALSDVAEGGEG